jgi:ketosteroid isomerase-like protein
MADNNHSNETQIRKLVENWAKAVRDGDMQGVLAHHADDIVTFDVPPPLQSKGMAEYKKTWDLFFQYSPGGEGSFDLVELKINAAGNLDEERSRRRGGRRSSLHREVEQSPSRSTGGSMHCG